MTWNRAPGQVRQASMTPEEIEWCREHPMQWLPLPSRYWANASTWPHDVRKGKFTYLGGMAERWDCTYRVVYPEQRDENGRLLYEVKIAYLGER